MKLIIAIITIILAVSCDNNQESQSHIRDITEDVEIVTIDSCEYVRYQYYKGCGLAHKGNCKFCKERERRNHVDNKR